MAPVAPHAPISSSIGLSSSVRRAKLPRPIHANQSADEPPTADRKPNLTIRVSYLRSAAHQPIDWHEWGEEAFARAQKEDKPMLLDIGAVWCTGAM